MSESLQFPSLFSRLVFISQRLELPKSLEWSLQNIRIKTNFLLRSENNLILPYQYQQAKEILIAFFRYIDGDKEIEIPGENSVEANTLLTLDKLRVQVLEIHSEEEFIICQCEALPEHTIAVKYNVSPVNDSFNNTIESLWIGGAQLNLVDVKRDERGFYIPKILVLEPDYLIDASAMAECFQSYGNSHLHYFRRKFEQPVNTHYILLGNLANFFFWMNSFMQKMPEA